MNLGLARALADVELLNAITSRPCMHQSYQLLTLALLAVQFDRHATRMIGSPTGTIIDGSSPFERDKHLLGAPS